jgi:uncharacterized protein
MSAANIQKFFQAIRAGEAAEVGRMLAADRKLVTAREESGLGPFTAAKYSRQEEIAALLLANGAELDIFEACIAGDGRRIDELLSADPKLVNEYSHDGWTPLHLAAFFAEERIAAALLNRGADAQARSHNAMENTPLHAAAAARKAAVIALLLERGADVNARQHGGWTALHAASQNGDVSLVRLLLAHGANVEAKAANNQTAMDLAMTGGRQEVVDLLDGHQTRGHGAS